MAAHPKPPKSIIDLGAQVMRREVARQNQQHLAKAKALTQNNEAERSLLGAMMIAYEAFAAAVDALTADDFFEFKHQAMFEALSNCPRSEQGVVDVVMLDEELKRTGRLADVTQAYTHDVVNTCPNAYRYPEYLRIVLECSLAREQQHIGADLDNATISAGEAITRLEALATRRETVLDLAAAGIQQGIMTARDLMALDLPPIPFYVSQLLPQGLTLFAAKPKSGKSWMVDAMAIAIASGGRALGQLACDQPRDVLLCALEDTDQGLKDRLRLLLGSGPNKLPAPERLEVMTTGKLARLDKGGTDKIATWLRHHRGGVVILDTLGAVRAPRAKGEDIYTDDRNTMQPLKDLADHYDAAILVVYHTSKRAADDPLDQVSGSTGLTAACDNVMVLQRAGAGKADAILHARGRVVVEVEWAMTFDKPLCLWSIAGEAEEFQRSDERDAIIRLLREANGEPMQPADIAAILDAPPNNVRKLLFTMYHQHQVRKDRGGYVLPSP